MPVIQPINNTAFPFHWVDMDNLRNSDANRVEIYLPEDEGPTIGMAEMFTELFPPIEKQICL